MRSIQLQQQCNGNARACFETGWRRLDRMHHNGGLRNQKQTSDGDKREALVLYR
jgi:hypothetical protein